MDNNYDLTIIMSNYNQEKYIAEAINSVYSQIVNFRYKLIIVDDHSCNDISKEIINKYANEYNNIKTIFGDYHGGYLCNILRAIPYVNTRFFVY